MLEKIVQPLEMWYDRHKRPLPWREKKDPYRIWVSEIMLQQTRVEAVKPFYARFIEALPDCQALAVCPEDKLMKLWEGLGYYSRVRNMQKAAGIVTEKYDGILPADYKKLLELPGIGHYTAGAVASIAYGIPVPAVDGNVLRVLSRVRDDDRDILKQSLKTEVEADLQKIMPAEHPDVFNQALMELGATVCVPNGAPHCEDCPLYDLCLARQAGREAVLPVKKKAKKRRLEKYTILLLLTKDCVVVQKRPADGLLAGMYEFPHMEGYVSKEEAAAYVQELGFVPGHIESLPKAKHIFSHVEWHMTGYLIDLERQDPAREMKEALQIEKIETVESEYAIPAAYAAYARYLNLYLGQEKYENT